MQDSDYNTRERRREREFYKYYDSIRILNDHEPQWTNLYDDEAAKQHVPRASPDHTLTALCQLGAHRLAARRSLLFFFDRDYAYILAEATRTISLMNDDLHDVDDALWLGNTIIPRGLAVCEHTMNIPGELGTPTQSQHKADEILIINDLKENNNFCDRPFVTDGPKARFYAGVPITTPAGIRIGVYCILDDHPREGLNDAEVTFMHEMADTVMSHLELLRIHTEFRRQNRMLQGLNSFVKDGPTSGPGPPKSPPRPVIDELADNPNSASDEDIAIASSPPNSPNKQRGTSNRFSALAHTEVHDYASEGEEEPAERRSLGQAQRRLSKQMNRDSGGGARNILQRASDVLREAIDADGVVFLDASTQVVNGTSSCPNSGTDTATTDGSDDTLRHTQDNDCRTLGRSHRSISPGNLPMPENLLKRLLAKHPLGKIWIFNSDGEVSSTEEGTSDTLAGAENSESSQGRRHRRGKKSHEAYEIRRLFPEARAVCLVGMWDSVRQRWFAGSLLWSYSASRIFSAQGEIAYAMAFCDVVFANVARRESKMNARAKTDFISSLSHELRSPLHGIIGSMELLQERNTLDHTLISQMEKCTTVLTDVVEQLLDFAKIESRVKSNRRQRGLKQRQPSLDSVLGISSMEDPGQTLARLTEEVADAIFYSHCCKVGRQASSKVDFVLDISAQADLYINGATGSWKRICGNIIGNALKFTTAGHVSISLKALVRKRKQPVAVLSVSDTGCGMSQEFVATELFRPFAQEDMLTVGAGLGLSVVAKLVKALGGKVEVQTNKGSGTTITVALPLNSSSLVEKRTPPGNSPPLIGLLETDGDFSEDEDAVSARRLHLAGIESACRHRGAQLTCSEQAQVNLIFEDDLDRLLDQGHLKRHADGAHIVILCRSLLSAFQLQNANHTFANAGHVEYLCQPYGPERLGSAIFNCLQADTSQHTSPQTCTLRGIPQRNVALLPRPNASYEGSLYLDDMMARKAMNDSTPPDLKDKGLQLLVTEVSLTPNVEVLSPNPAWPKDPRKLSLLLVDDNPVNLRLLTAYADKNKHPRLSATNGREAVDVYKASATTSPSSSSSSSLSSIDIGPKPDVVFLDINMPIMDGFQAARAIRAFEKQTQIPPTVLIALTCLGSAEAKLEAESCGMDLFLTKPVKPREITKILENVRGIVEENHRNMDWKIADKDAVECNAQLIDAMKMAKLPQEDEVELLEVVQDANEPSSIATSVRL